MRRELSGISPSFRTVFCRPRANPHRYFCIAGWVAGCALVVPWGQPEHARAVVLALLHTAFAGTLGGSAPSCLARVLTGTYLVP